jgi:hypothetical protein
VRRSLLLAVAACLVGCGAPTTPAPVALPVPTTSASASPSPAPVPSPSSARPSHQAVKAVWTIGASPLPLRPDGFGQVLTTPAVLRDRRMTAVSRLPAPVDGRFASTVSAVSPAVRERMGETWSPACPVALADLRYLTISFRGFDGDARTGELVVNASVAGDLVEVFRRLFDDGFPIEEMRLPTTADLEAPPTGDGNNTVAYVCRAARGQTRWSQHAYGLAVDVNPFQNPQVKRDLVVPELASAYVDRGAVRPGMVLVGGPVVRAFTGIGWEWGGTWRSSKDWMHVSRNGQ